MISFDLDVKLDYSDVMLVPRCDPNGPNSRAEVSLINKNGFVPVIASNMDGVGTFEMALELAKYDMITALHKHYTLDQLVYFFSTNQYISNHTIYSMGSTDEDFTKFHNFYRALRNHPINVHTVLPMICIDVANGYTQDVAKFIRKMKYDYPMLTLIAGNVVTEEGVFHMADAGADIIKIGVGPGSVCTTRSLTGIGYPQFSAVLECVKAARIWRGRTYHQDRKIQNKPEIIADGGITCPGDIAKALAAGANYVMVGGMFAGHDEGGGAPCGAGGEFSAEPNPNIIPTYFKTHRKFYGMASKTAQDKHNGGVANYRASEGKEVVVPYRGPVKETVQQILGGLRSSCAYQGVKQIDDLSVYPKFIRVNRQLNNVFGN